MSFLSEKGQIKINTICYLNKNLRLFEELQKELSYQFKELFRNNKYSLIDSSDFLITDNILTKLKKNIDNNKNYSKKGIIYEKDIVSVENLTLNDLKLNILFLVNTKKSNNNNIYLDIEKVNEVFEDFTNITFKNPLVESKQLLDFVKNQNEKNIDSEEGTLQFLTKKIKTNLRINKKFSLLDLELNNNNFKYREHKKILLENKNLFFLKEHSSKLKEVIEEIIIPLKTMTNQLFPIMRQLESRSNLILNIIEGEKDYNKKLLIVKKFNKEIRQIKILFESGGKKKSFKSVFEIRFNFIIHFLKPILNGIDIDFEDDISSIDEIFNLFSENSQSLFKNINLIYTNMEKEESKIIQELYSEEFKSIFSISESDSNIMKVEKIEELYDFLDFGENPDLTLTERLKIKEIEDYDVTFERQLQVLENLNIQNKSDYGILEKDRSDNLKTIEELEVLKDKEKIEREKINKVIEFRFNFIMDKLDYEDFKGYDKLIELKIISNKNISISNINEYIQYRDSGVYFQEYLKWINNNYDTFKFDIEEDLLGKETYIQRKVNNNIKKEFNKKGFRNGN